MFLENGRAKMKDFCWRLVTLELYEVKSCQSIGPVENIVWSIFPKVLDANP